MISHPGVPVAEQIDGDLYRVYFTSRDAQSRSHVGWVEIDIRQPDRILRLSDHPLLEPGATGAFDDAGTTLSCLVRQNGKQYAYYIGWHLRASVPYHLAIGLAIGDEIGEPSVTRLPGPILERSPVDPLFCTSPYVMYEAGRWRMWYVSGIGWPKVAGRVVPSYRTVCAESDDGVLWHRVGAVALQPQDDELGFSRPCVLRDGSGYSMWYSIRRETQSYRLGYARSKDGIAWTRDDNAAGLAPSAGGWDADMVAYPHVFDHDGHRYMLYCGNDFGRAGLGLAVLA
jgi:predicted GH43/DUF377 family glycosyl hydrolase